MLTQSHMCIISLDLTHVINSSTQELAGKIYLDPYELHLFMKESLFIVN